MTMTPETAAPDADRRQAAAELQDLLVHGLATLNIQAGAALALIESDPARTRDALMAISTLARHAMGELRRLGVLLGAEEDAPRHPQPRLGDAVGFVLPARAQLAVVRVVEAALAVLPDVARPELLVRASPAAVTIDLRGAGGWSAGATAELEARVRLYGGTVRWRRDDPEGLALRVRLAIDDGG
jgi:hypothetical protein